MDPRETNLTINRVCHDLPHLALLRVTAASDSLHNSVVRGLKRARSFNPYSLIVEELRRIKCQLRD